jgi:hypothetical protein
LVQKPPAAAHTRGWGPACTRLRKKV